MVATYVASYIMADMFFHQNCTHNYKHIATKLSDAYVHMYLKIMHALTNLLILDLKLAKTHQYSLIVQSSTIPDWYKSIDQILQLYVYSL